LLGRIDKDMATDDTERNGRADKIQDKTPLHFGSSEPYPEKHCPILVPR
jgi:hypothetical protein